MDPYRILGGIGGVEVNPKPNYGIGALITSVFLLFKEPCVGEVEFEGELFCVKTDDKGDAYFVFCCWMVYSCCCKDCIYCFSWDCVATLSSSFAWYCCIRTLSVDTRSLRRETSFVCSDINYSLSNLHFSNCSICCLYS